MKIGTQQKKITLKQRFKLAVCTMILYGFVLLALQFILPFEKRDFSYILLQSILFGFIFVFSSTYLLNRNYKEITNFFSKHTYPINSNGEKIIAEGPANLFRGIEGVGGKLFLTDEAIIFSAHKFNIQRDQTKILLSSIQKIKTCYSSKLLKVDNGLKIITKNDETFHFVLNERENWINYIEELLLKKQKHIL